MWGQQWATPATAELPSLFGGAKFSPPIFAHLKLAVFNVASGTGILFYIFLFQLPEMTIPMKFTIPDCLWGHFFRVTDQATN